jgi:hypothetical protein
MRESRMYGSVRGARGNSRPYRVQCSLLRCESLVMARTGCSLQRSATSAIKPANHADQCPQFEVGADSNPPFPEANGQCQPYQF